MGKTILLSIATAMLFSCGSGGKESVYKNAEGEDLLTIELSSEKNSVVNVWYQSDKDGPKEKGTIEKQEFMEESDNEPALIMADVKINSLGGGSPALVLVEGDKVAIVLEDETTMKFELQK